MPRGFAQKLKIVIQILETLSCSKSQFNAMGQILLSAALPNAFDKESQSNLITESWCNK